MGRLNSFLAREREFEQTFSNARLSSSSYLYLKAQQNTSLLKQFNIKARTYCGKLCVQINLFYNLK